MVTSKTTSTEKFVSTGKYCFSSGNVVFCRKYLTMTTRQQINTRTTARDPSKAFFRLLRAFGLHLNHCLWKRLVLVEACKSGFDRND